MYVNLVRNILDLRLKQRCGKFWTVVNSGIEEAYTGRPLVSFGKTNDLKT